MARRGLARAENKQKRYKVEGSGRRWHVWGWKPGKPVSQWVIIQGPYLTRRRAETEMERL